MKEKVVPGINIQYPISQEIVSGRKTIETREYPIPIQYLMSEMALIETPGIQKGFRARVVAIVKFTNCFMYKNKDEFYSDFSRHLVDRNSPWAWKDKHKYGWEVQVVTKFEEPFSPKERRGILYAKKITLPSNLT